MLYFSGTGNSRYVAKSIKKITGDKVLSINELLKSNKNNKINSQESFVFVCPTYAWKIPRGVESFIKNSEFSGSKDIYFILTYGAETGNAVSYIKKLCAEKEFNFKGFAEVDMPDNYIAMYDVPNKEKANEIIKKADKVIIHIGEDIKNGESFDKKRISVGGNFKSSVINSMFYSFFVRDKGFYATDSCISCGKCSKLCSLSNIKIINGKPKWSGNCIHCMACISWCPTKAIEYKNKTQDKSRYYNNRN